jgi:3-hydroxyacyl-CoA dehydrogenase/enoyl-CoA hydratase/3-hydroxybutyryl-CoA epimerase
VTAETSPTLIHAETDGDGIRTLIVDAVDRPMNVLSPELRAQLIAAVDAALADDAVRGVVFVSRRKEFIAGADLTVLGSLRGRPVPEVRRFSTPFRTMLRRMEQAGKPVVAAINGTALGGGFELCLACHHRIAADVPGALIGLPESQLGILPGAGGTQRLPRLMGIAPALPMVLEGRRLSPAQALEAGLVDALVPLDALEQAAKAWILSGPEASQPWDRPGFSVPGGGPDTPGMQRLLADADAKARSGAALNDPSPAAIVTCFRDGVGATMDEGLEIEGQEFARLAQGDVAQNRIRAFFSMGAARKAATRPAGVAAFKPARLGILGAGMMGRGLAEVAALRGLDVVLLDRDRAAAEAGLAFVRESLGKAQARGRVKAADAEAALARIGPSEDVADLAGVEAIIEAVYEDRAVKAEITPRAIAAAGEGVLFASNTSKLPITSLAEASPRPDRFIGMHFFSPVPRMALLEIILGEKTGAEAHAQALDLGRLLGKTAIVVRDGRGFFTSRVFSTYINEGIAMLAEGVDPALIEDAGKQAGMPTGPLAMADEISQETMLRIRSQERDDLGDKWVRGREFDIVERFVGMGRGGRRTGAGFYDYPAEGTKALWPGLAEMFPRANDQPEIAEAKRRLLQVQATEAARAWAEGVIDDPRMADVGSLLGWSFPAWTGGVMSYIDQGGLDGFMEHAARLTEAHGPRFDPPQKLKDLAAAGGSLYA